MKKLITTPGKWLGIVLALVTTTLLFSACSKNNDDFQLPPSAGFMAFNLAPDRPSIGFALSGNQLGNVPLAYTNYTGTYLPIYVGQREVRSFDYNNGTTLATNNETFLDSSYYSAFLIGANGFYRNVVVRDSFENVIPVSGKAWVRYINAVADTSANPVITIGDQSEPAGFGIVSAFKQVNAGDIVTTIADGGDINVSRTINFEENKIYTILYVGNPTNVDPNLAVQIKFIQNGTATN